MMTYKLNSLVIPFVYQSSWNVFLLSVLDVIVHAIHYTKHQTVSVYILQSFMYNDQLPSQIAIKAADISNPARCLSLSKTWSESIMEEFFRQGQ